jgi:hypothetical protein
MVVAGAIATRYGLRKTPSGRRASSLVRIEKGSLRRSLPPTASTSKVKNFFVMLCEKGAR